MAQYIQSGKYVQPSYVRAPAPAKVAVRRHHPFELVAIKDAVRQDDITRVKNERKGGLDIYMGGTDSYTGSADTIRPPARTRLNRNNTDFPLKLLEYFRGLPEESEYGFLKYYQNITREYTKLATDTRGLLIYYTMGMGKSILAVTLAIEQIKIKPVVLILAKALQDNMRSAIHKYVRMRTQSEPSFYLGMLSATDLNAWIDRNFSFVSLNASNMAKQVSAISSKAVSEFDAALEQKFGEIVKMGNLDGKTIIVDEAHNLMRMITNGSQNGIKLYDMIMSAKNASVYLLTGTPISNNPFELVPCMNMIAGRVILPTDYAEFTKAFVSHDGYIANKGKFMNRIFGLVSHVSHYDTPGAALFADPAYAARHTASGTSAEFPEQKPTIVERIPMTTGQYTLYQLARDKEMDEGKSTGFAGKKGPSRASPALTKPKSGASSSYRVRSRQLSNWAPATSNGINPADLANATNVTDNHSHTYTGESCKFPRILENLNKHRGQTGLLYSQFVSNGGLGSLARYLEANGWEEVKITSKQQTMSTTNELPQEDTEESPTSASAMPTIDDIIDIGDDAITGGYYGSADAWFIDSSADVVGGMDIVGTHSSGSDSSSDEDDADNNPADDGSLSITGLLGKKIDIKNVSDLHKLSKLAKLAKLSKMSRMEHIHDDPRKIGNIHIHTGDKKSKSEKFIIRNATMDDVGTMGLTAAELTYPMYAVLVMESKKPRGVFVVEYTRSTVDIDGRTARMCAGKLIRYESDLPPCVSRAVFTKLVNDTSVCVKSAEEFLRRIWPGQNIDAVVDIKKGAGWRVGGADAPRRFAVISGDVSADDRTTLANMFNSAENISGGLIDLLMVSSTGAEGLDLKNGRHVHILEPYWTWNRILQVIARLVRNDSHIGLPADQRDVTPYIYLAVPPETEPQLPTTDTELYDESLADHGLIESFHEAMREASIECMVNGGKNCRQCAPTNEPLYSDDLFRDLRSVDPCQPVVTTEITAKDITVDGVVYHYLPDPASVFGWKILRKDAAVDSWRKVPEHDAAFLAVMEAINPEILGIGI